MYIVAYLVLISPPARCQVRTLVGPCPSCGTFEAGNEPIGQSGVVLDHLFERLVPFGLTVGTRRAIRLCRHAKAFAVSGLRALPNGDHAIW